GWSVVAAVAVTVGPGSFTGIRVGLAAARGRGLALGVPVLGETIFEAVAWGVPALVRDAGGLVVLIDSGRGSRFVQGFDPTLRPRGAPMSVELARLSSVLPPPPCTVVAVGAPPVGCLGTRPIVVAAPDAAALAELAAARRAAGGDFVPATPLYLRPPDAAVPPAGGRIRA
ncbi:MAG: tRNA (adenosine(37)-N6)-threonylcarbamoyltransferase complex dimerization subunit type 1 TsaB, partial [Proteobacteria bacterium]|nr:tRNA (adenosine(37)-N6)-threonylcarbamoyltransferase complex dimerization subunit type 1 TsaB [Pseudomonadota bacterium]